MQQYRVNYTLLIALVIGTLVASGAAFGLWKFQINRNAGSLITSAHEYENQGDIRKAAADYANYLSIRPDDDEVRVKLANMWAEVTALPDAKPEEVSRSIYMLEETVRKMPEQKELQRKLVDLYGRMGGVQQAIDHLNLMVQKYPGDADLYVKQMEYLIRARKFEGQDGAIALGKKLVGYDDKEDTFDAKKALAPNNAQVYGNLAGMLRSAQQNTELADRVMAQLVKENPESADAFLQRGQYLVAIGEPDRGHREIEKAYRLAPKDANVLLAMAGRAQASENFDQAREFLNRGNKEYPADARFYQGLAGLEIKDKNYEKALAFIDDGLKQVSRDDKLNLLFYKAELQFLSNDVPGARATAEEMRQAGFRPEFVAWVEARILLAQSKWYEASRALRKLDQQFITSMGISDDVNNQLGLCHEKLGQPDLALQRYEVVLQRNPTNEPAKLGVQRLTAARGVAPMQRGPQKDIDFDAMIAEVLAQPVDKRDWSNVDEQFKKIAEQQKLEGAILDLYWARINLMREDYAAARKFLVAGRNKDPENLQIQRTAVQLLLRDPSQGPDRAMKLLDQVVERFGDLPVLRLDRADLLIATNEKDPNEELLKQQLAKLSEPPADWNDNQKIELWNGLAGRYLLLKMRPEAKASLERVVALRPSELQTLVALFSLALEDNDDVVVNAAQEKILKVVGSKNDHTWLYTEARRRLADYRQAESPDKNQLDAIRNLTDRALKQRPDWFELHLVQAETELLAGNEDAALANFDAAAKLGRPNPNAILQHVRLLLNRGRVEPARVLIEQLPKNVRENELGQLYAEVLFSLGDMDKAAEVGEKFVATAPDNAERNLRYGQLLARFAMSPKVSEDRRKELLDKAGKSLQRSVELGPEFAEAWLALITYYTVQQDADQAMQALQQAQLALPEDQLIGVLAKAYEIVGGRSWFDAETMYLTLYNANPDNLRLTQELARFYLSPAYPAPDKFLKATPLVNKLLHNGAEGGLDPNDPAVRWARRAGAEMLAATRDYQQLLKAEKLLASNSRDGALAAEDRVMMARILAGRPEPISRDKAIKLLEQLQNAQRLSLEDSLILGQLYFAMGDTYWEKCKKQMLQTVLQNPDSVPARAAFIEMLIRRGSTKDYPMATTQLTKFREIAPNDIRNVQYTVEIASKTGKQDDARKYLTQLLPDLKNPSALTDEQLAITEFVAGMLAKIGDYDAAEKIYRVVTQRNPRKAIALGEFLGTHRNVDEGMEILSQNFSPDAAEPIARTALAVIRARRDEIGDKYDAQVQQWLDRALLENPDSIPLLMLQAEFDDTRKEYDGAAAIYQKLLARNDLTGITRAIVLNNLAFLVSLAGTEAETGVDPLTLVQQAAGILGPTADILDTRAVVYITHNEHQKAIRDLEYSVLDNPTPAKYFHKAVAHLGAGENKAAVESWNKAESLGDIRSNLNRMEYDLYDQVKPKIDALRNQNPTKLTEADKFRAAG
jgi:cellulose synthase operon protein C